MEPSIHRKLQDFLKKYEKSQNDSIQCLETHRKNLRRVIAGLLMLRQSLSGKLSKTQCKDLARHANGPDPDTTLLPLLLPKLVEMLRPGGDEIDIALMYLQISIEKKILPAQSRVVAISTPESPNSKSTLEGSSFIVSIRTALDALLQDLDSRKYWKQAEAILAMMNRK